MNVIVKSQMFRQGSLLYSHRFDPRWNPRSFFFAGLLTGEDIRSAIGDATALSKRWIYTPLVT